MVWYNPADSAAAATKARAILKHALQIKPNATPVLEAYCRFLNATNEFTESLVAYTAMAKALALRPGSNVANVMLPTKNASPAFLAAATSLERAFVAAGLPEH